VTVCIAALSQWNYGTRANPDPGHLVIVLTDRMITAGDVQYEPQQTKHAHITPNILLVIAGDYSTHSRAIKKITEHFQIIPSASPESVAIFYGRSIQELKLKEAEDLYLAPLGLNPIRFWLSRRTWPRILSHCSRNKCRHIAAKKSMHLWLAQNEAQLPFMPWIPRG
jgi:hypothetical protein